MKRFHGLSRARGWGLRSMLFQAKLTAIAVNLKRIAAIVGEKMSKAIAFLSLFRIFENTKPIFPKINLQRDRKPAYNLTFSAVSTRPLSLSPAS